MLAPNGRRVRETDAKVMSEPVDDSEELTPLERLSNERLKADVARFYRARLRRKRKIEGKKKK